MAVMQRAGLLRERISLQSRTQTRSSQGSFINSFTTMATVAASVVPVENMEFQASNKPLDRTTHIIRIRFFAGLTASMRLLYRGRYLNIVGIKNLEERRKIIELQCQEIPLDGESMLDDDGLPMLDDDGNPMFEED